MTNTPDITRPKPELIEALKGIGAATASAELHRLGIRNTHIEGVKSWTPGHAIVGPAITLQFMPIREDVYQDDEYGDPEAQLHRHALYHCRAGDVVVVDARGKMDSGVFGEMIMTYLKGRGGAGVIIDGCLRDWPNIQKIDIGCWIKGLTPNYHTQRSIFPYGVNVPIGYVDKLLGRAKAHVEWEEFSRLRLSEGGDLRRYYPLSEEARDEYEAWKSPEGK